MSPLPSPRARWMLTAQAPGVAPVTVGLGTGAYTVGRDPGCQLVLHGKQVSRRHATLVVGHDPFVMVEDLGSYNGIRLDGQRVPKVQLRPGQALSVGEWTLALQPASQLPRDAVVLTADLASEGAALERTSSVETAVARVPPMSVPDAERSGLRRSLAPAVSSVHKRVTTGSAVAWQTGPGQGHEVRERAVAQSALLRRLTSQMAPLDQAVAVDPSARSLGSLARGEDTQELALRLVYQVMGELRAARGEDEFLSAMARMLHDALRADAVAVLMVPQDGRPRAADVEPRALVGAFQGGGAVRFSRSIVDLALSRGVAVATADATQDDRFSRRDSVVNLELKAAVAVPMLRDAHAVGVLYLTRAGAFSDDEEDLAAAVGHLAALGVERVRLKAEKAGQEALQHTLERFHTPEVVEKLMQREAAGGGLFLENLTATVLFCDLQGFTTYCDRHGPRDVAELLNAYLGEMTRVVYEHHGTVDKFIGDAVMAVFGAPFPAEDDALRAVRCGLAMQRAFAALMETRPEMERLALRIGINTGPVVAGTVGSMMRMEYTCLGDTVNVAQRLEGRAPPGGVLVGEATAEAVRAEVDLQPVENLQLKGKAGPVTAHLALRERTSPPGG